MPMTSSAIGRAGAAVLTVAILFFLLALFAVPSQMDTKQAIEVTGTPWAYIPFVRKHPTPTPGAIIRIVEIYLPPVLPKAHEYVKIENQGGSPQVMTDWKLKNEVGGEVFHFPEFTLQPGSTVKVHSRLGNNDDDNLYWAHSEHNFPVWQRGETACLYAPDWTQEHCYP